MKSKKVFLIIRLGTWHMWPSWQPGRVSTLTSHPTLNFLHTIRDREICQHTAQRLPAQIKTNTKLSCQHFRFNDLPVATAGDAGGEKLGRAAPSLSSCLRGLGLVSPPSSLARRCIPNFTACGVWHQAWENFPQFPLKNVKLREAFNFLKCQLFKDLFKIHFKPF